MKLGEWLKGYRKRNKMTMQELASVCGFSKAYIGMLEKGVNPTTGKPVSPTLQTFDKIAKGTGRDLDSLLKIIDGDQPVTISPVNHLDGEELKLVDNYRVLNAEDKDLLWTVLRRLRGTSEQKINVNKVGNNYGVVSGEKKAM